MSSEMGIEALVKQIYRLGAVRRQLLGEALPEISGQGFTALAALYRLGPARVSEIAGHLAVDLSVASRQIQTLYKAGYVERHPDPDDGRAHLLSLNESGLQALRQSHRRMVEASARALAGWDPRELSDLVGALERLRADFIGEDAAASGSPSPAAPSLSTPSRGRPAGGEVGAAR